MHSYLDDLPIRMNMYIHELCIVAIPFDCSEIDYSINMINYKKSIIIIVT